MWLTLSSGPRCSRGIAGCGPLPNSCTGTAVRFTPATGVTTETLAFPRSMLVTSAVPSPDGRLVALSAGGCATSFFNAHLTIRNLRSGRQWTLGAGAAPCHVIGEPAWNLRSTELVFPYGPSVLPRHAHVTGAPSSPTRSPERCSSASARPPTRACRCSTGSGPSTATRWPRSGASRTRTRQR